VKWKKSSQLKILVGLGNPGSQYQDTRHNIGFALVDSIAQRCQAEWKDSAQENSLLAEITVAGQNILLAKPQTYMNGSGRAVKKLCDNRNCLPGGLLIVYDDFLLNFGRVRLRPKGSDGGHNGLASILENLSTNEIPRLRLGIGSPEDGIDVIDYVLGNFDEVDKVPDLLSRGVAAIEMYLTLGIEEAMSRFNGRF
tara:strand:+ start:712 stop:1299 length:588 start_codon:yes stop_codon:yes gene_type:complete